MIRPCALVYKRKRKKIKTIEKKYVNYIMLAHTSFDSKSVMTFIIFSAIAYTFNAHETLKIMCLACCLFVNIDERVFHLIFYCDSNGNSLGVLLKIFFIWSTSKYLS